MKLVLGIAFAALFGVSCAKHTSGESVIAAAEDPITDWDGCYNFYREAQPGVAGGLFPTVCISGSAEEGIGGAGVRLAAFASGQLIPASCMKSTSRSITGDSFTFVKDNRNELVLKNVKIVSKAKQGDAVLGRTNLGFIEETRKSVVENMLGVMNRTCEFSGLP